MRKTMTIDPHRFGTASQAITEAKRRLWVSLDEELPKEAMRRRVTVVKCDYQDKTWNVELEVTFDHPDQYFR